VYKDVDDMNTEWNDIQCKLGNLPEKQTLEPTPGFVAHLDWDNALKDATWLQEKSIEKLKDLEDDTLL